MAFGLDYTLYPTTNVDESTGVRLGGADEEMSFIRVPLDQCASCDQDQRHCGYKAYQCSDMTHAADLAIRAKHKDWEYCRGLKAMNILMDMIERGLPFAADWPATDIGNVTRDVGGWTFGGSPTVYFDESNDPRNIPGFGVGTPCLIYLANSVLSHFGGWLAYPSNIYPDGSGGQLTFELVSKMSMARGTEALDPEQPVLLMCRLWALGYEPQYSNFPDVAFDDFYNGNDNFNPKTYPDDGTGQVSDPIQAVKDLISSRPWVYRQDFPLDGQHLRRVGGPSLFSNAGVPLIASGRMYPGRDYVGWWSGGWGAVHGYTANGVQRYSLRGGIEYFEDNATLGPGGVRQSSLYGDETNSTNDPEGHYVSCLKSSRLGRHQYGGYLLGPFLATADFRATSIVVPRIAEGDGLQTYPGLTFQRRFYDSSLVECEEDSATYGEIVRLTQTQRGFKSNAHDNDGALMTRNIVHYNSISGGYKLFVGHVDSAWMTPGPTGDEDFGQNTPMGATTVCIGSSRRPTNWGSDMSVQGAAASYGAVRGNCIKLVHSSLSPLLASLRWPIMVARACDTSFCDPTWVAGTLGGVPGFENFIATAAGCDSLEVQDESGTLAMAMSLIAASGTMPQIQIMPLAYAKGEWAIKTGGPDVSSDTAVSEALCLPASGVFLLPVGLDAPCRILSGTACFRSDLPSTGGDYPDTIFQNLWES